MASKCTPLFAALFVVSRLPVVIGGGCSKLPAVPADAGGSAAVTWSPDPDKKSPNCTQKINYYEKSPCGVKDKSLTCCGSKQACIGPIKPKKGDDKYACSKLRAIDGPKAMKLVIIPLLFGAADILCIVFMVLKCNIKENHVTKACIAAIAVSWPILLSAKANFGIWSGFLAIFVAFMSNSNQMPRWVYRFVWAMIVFQVVLIFGPNETFHVPIFNQSLTGCNSDLVNNLVKLKEADCDKYFAGFFKIHSIEKEAVGFNTDLEYYGLCTEQWLGVLQTMAMLEGVVWMVTALVSAPIFLPEAMACVKEA